MRHITSPGYPDKYPNYVDCKWNLIAPHEKKIKLSFYDFNLGYPGSCLYDYLNVYDGISTKYNKIKTLCGNTLPDNIFSSGNALVLEFHTNWKYQHKGFKLSYNLGIRGKLC